MMSSAAMDVSPAESQSLPCPSCGGETSDEFVANGPSKGLRTTCRVCGPIDVLSISVMDLPQESSDEAPAGEPSGDGPFRFQETSGEERSLAEPSSPAPESHAPMESGGLSLAVAETRPEPMADDAEAISEEVPEGSNFAEEASTILEEAAIREPQRPGTAADPEIPEIDHADSSYEMTPGIAAGRIRHSAIDAAGRTRNRQVALAGLGGVAVLAGLIGLDLYLRPLAPTSGFDVPRPARAAVAPAEVEPPAAAPATAMVAEPRGLVAEPRGTDASTTPAAVKLVPPAPVAEAPEPAVAARAAVPRQEPEVPTSRWFSQTGVPPTRRNAVVKAGLYSADAQRAAGVRAPARAEPQGSMSPAEAVEPPAAAPEADPVWRTLRPGMNSHDVVRVLGKPRWKSTSVALEFWMYEQHSILGSGVVVFDNRGVFSWREPSRPRPQG